VVQGVTELFPVSSLGYAVLVPALIGGSWARDLSMSADQSPCLAFLVAVHVATAVALVVFFRRRWIGVRVPALPHPLLRDPHPQPVRAVLRDRGFVALVRVSLGS
jgi:undecaprenyl pyrophosphate phosphatase UppP